MCSHISNIDTFHLSTHIAITIIGHRSPADWLYTAGKRTQLLESKFIWKLPGFTISKEIHFTILSLRNYFILQRKEVTFLFSI